MQPCITYPLVWCDSPGVQCNGGAEKAFDEHWQKKNGQWDTCGMDKIVVVNITRQDGVPSIDGFFMRAEGTGQFNVSYFDESSGGWVPVGAAFSFGGGSDVSFNFGQGFPEFALWMFDFSAEPACLNVTEIGFNGTCQVMHISLRVLCMSSGFLEEWSRRRA